MIVNKIFLKKVTRNLLTFGTFGTTNKSVFLLNLVFCLLKIFTKIYSRHFMFYCSLELFRQYKWLTVYSCNKKSWHERKVAYHGFGISRKKNLALKQSVSKEEHICVWNLVTTSSIKMWKFSKNQKKSLTQIKLKKGRKYMQRPF